MCDNRPKRLSDSSKNRSSRKGTSCSSSASSSVCPSETERSTRSTPSRSSVSLTSSQKSSRCTGDDSCDSRVEKAKSFDREKRASETITICSGRSNSTRVISSRSTKSASSEESNSDSLGYNFYRLDIDPATESAEKSDSTSDKINAIVLKNESSEKSSSESAIDSLISNEKSDTTATTAICSTGTTKSAKSKTCSTIDYAASSSSSGGGGSKDKIEYTLALIKPEAVRHREDIERCAKEAGFAICQSKLVRLTREQAMHFYLDAHDDDRFLELVEHVSSGPIVAMVLSKFNAILEWKLFMGPPSVSDAKVCAPKTIRGRFGLPGNEVRNAVHGSENEKAAKREIALFFPDFTVDKVKSKTSAEKYILTEIWDQLSEGIYQCYLKQPSDPIPWLGSWLLENNTKGPKYMCKVED